MSHFIDTLERQVIRNDRDKREQICLKDTPFQKLQPQTKRLLEGFTQLTIIRIINCDLRTLENFPVIETVTHIFLPNNKLQGSFQYLLPLKNLKYLDVSNNIIAKATSFYPLCRHKGLTIQVGSNPVVDREEDWRDVLQSYKLDVEDKPKLQPQLPADSWSKIKEEIQAEQKKLKVQRRPDIEDREKDRDRGYQKTLDNLISMVQMTNSNIESELAHPKRQSFGNRAIRRPVEDIYEPEDLSSRNSGRSYMCNIHMIMSPRSPDRRLATNPSDMFVGDFGSVEDRFDMASDQY